MLKNLRPKRRNLMSKIINISIIKYYLSSSKGRSKLLFLNTRISLIFLLLILLQMSCAIPTQIIRERSSSVKPEWIESLPQDNATLYFIGIKTSAETLEDGMKAAIRNAMSNISDYMGVKIESVFEDYISEVEQKLMYQIKSKSSATVRGAQVVDSYYEKMMRIDKNYKIEKYDVYVLVKFSKAEIANEIERQQKIKREKIKTAYNFYLNGINKENRKKYYDARRYYKQALTVVESLEDVLIIRGNNDIKNSDDLRLSLQAHLKNVTMYLSRVELSINIDGSTQSKQTFISNFITSLNEHGYTITDSLPAIKITGNIFVSQSSYTLNNYFFYAEGSVSAKRTSDKQIIAEYFFKVKGSHRLKKQAALKALEEAGLEAGHELAKMILEKETMESRILFHRTRLWFDPKGIYLCELAMADDARPTNL